MKVISLKNTTKLVKGGIYDVLKLQNQNTSTSRYFRPRVLIKLNDSQSFWFNVNNFKLENGNDLPETNWVDSSIDTINYSDLRMTSTYKPKVGEYVVYTANSHKTLNYNSIYKIVDVRTQEKTNYGRTYTWFEIKVEGSSRFLRTYSFRRCSAQELREISLSEVMELPTGVSKVDKSIRNIDKLSETDKQKQIARLFMWSCIDTTRNNLSIIDWACTKLGTKLSVKPTDFEFLNTMTFKEISEIFD